MCGICGIIRLQNTAPIEQDTLLAMRDALRHRGPDDAGIYLDEQAGLGSRRLAILDLSAQGRMPMCSEDGRYIIVHNGEVYNFRELRAGLEQTGFQFRSGTDTEVLLKLYIDRGAAMLSHCQGMFAFAIWDAQERTLFAARDRLGIKPFYYALHNGAFYFASEEKALFAAGASPLFDTSTAAELLLFRYISGERTPYQGVCRLLPGHFLTVKNNTVQTYGWWALRDNLQNQAATGQQREAITFRQKFDASVAQRRISDVPLGVLLSGGLDSSSVAATLAMQAGRDVASFTIRFGEAAFDEGAWAQEVAQKWGLNYHERFVSPQEIPALLEEATRLLDAPLAHGNDIHLLAIAHHAKPRVTVLLSGEGADETMGGYGRYRLFLYPWLLRFGGMARLANPVLPATGSLRRAAQILGLTHNRQRMLYSSAGVFPSEIALGGQQDLRYRNELLQQAAQFYREPIRQLMYYEQHTYLQSLLDRNDRMTMGASIECRVPFLDHRLVEWLAGLPTQAFFERGRGKALLRRAMSDRLPPAVLQHKKWGFTIPWAAYFREIPALRGWLQTLPQAEVVRQLPIEPTLVGSQVRQFLAGDDSLTSIIRQLAFITLWYAVCIQGKRQVLS
jgi:asparagine synthase (glutamine-hydrolysing)